jgi:exodeoxyribonuclease VII large subunit
MPTDLLSPTPSAESHGRDAWTVSRLNQEVKQLLDSSFGLLWLQGEISNFSKPASGHYYFSMKDSLAQIRCAMFKGRNRYLDFLPENGMQILARGRLSLYETRGEYQFVVEHIEEIGAGALQRQFEQRFEKFRRAGLFDENRKIPLVRYPQKIAIVTSPTGAALQDVLDVLARRYPVAEVLIYPTPVQGDGAAQKIARQISRAANERQCDTLLLVRGGGSIEDLWAFNEEVVVHAIADCPIPVVCGVGHEIDFTLADFAADARAPTPSVAAELACPDRTEVIAQFRYWLMQLQSTLENRIERQHDQLKSLLQRLSMQHPERQLQQKYQRCDELALRLSRAIEKHHTSARIALDQQKLKLVMVSPKQQIMHHRVTLEHRIQAMRSAIARRLISVNAHLKENMHALHIASPLATLERGYSITQREGEVASVTHIAELQLGEKISTRLFDGVVTSLVEKTKRLD